MVKIQGHPLEAVIDTGASESFASHQLLTSLGICHDKTTRTTYHAVTSGQQTTLGTATLQVQLGSQDYPIEVHVVNTGSFNLLVSAKFLRQHLAQVDLATNTLILPGNDHLPLLGAHESGDIDSLAAAVDASIFIPSRDAEYLHAVALFPLPTRSEIDARLQMGSGSSAEQREWLLERLTARPIISRAYTPNAPPPLPLQPIALPFKPGAQPPFAKQWPVSPQMRRVKEEMLRTWLRVGIVEPSHSHGNVPVFAKQEATKHRLLMDGREINELLDPMIFRPPLLSEVYSFMAEANFVTSIDAAAFFHQFRLDSTARSFFTFNGERLGRLQLTRLAQGSSVAPAIASAYLERLLQPVSDVAIAYVDNIVIRTTETDPESHKAAITRVLDILAEAEVTLNPKSFVWFGQANVPVLGVLWSRGSMTLTPKRKDNILLMPKPQTLDQLRSMTAALSQMSIFVPRSQLLAVPFNALIGAGKRFSWTPELERAYEDILQAVACAVELTYHQPGERLVVRSDASLVGWGGTLLVQRNDQLYPVVFVSRAWKGAEGSYSNNRREAIGLLRTVEKLRQYIQGEPNVRYETDNSAVSKIIGHTGDDIFASIGRALSEFGVKKEQLHHVEGKNNAIADWASRVPIPNPDPKVSSDEFLLPTALATEAASHTPEPVHSGVITVEQQQTDELVVRLTAECRALTSAIDRETELPDGHRLREAAQRFRVIDDLLYRVEYSTEDEPDCPGHLTIVVPHQLVESILRFCHESYGHPAGSRLVSLLRQRYWFPSMIKRAKDFTKSCHTCQVSLKRSPVVPGTSIRDPEGIGQHVYIDHGHVGEGEGDDDSKRFLVLVDQASGFMAAAPANSRDTSSVIRAIHGHWIRPYGPPAKITGDGAREFASDKLYSYLQSMGTLMIHSSGYNPQANIAETAVKKVKNSLRKAMTDQLIMRPARPISWSQMMDRVVHDWNTTVSEAIGATPATVFFGRRVNHPTDATAAQIPRLAAQQDSNPATIREAAAETKAANSERRQVYFDRDVQRLIFPVGTKVLRCHQRINPLGKEVVRVSGPYVIHSRISDTSYRLAELDGSTLEDAVHGRWIQPYYVPTSGVVPMIHHPPPALQLNDYLTDETPADYNALRGNVTRVTEQREGPHDQANGPPVTIRTEPGKPGVLRTPSQHDTDPVIKRPRTGIHDTKTLRVSGKTYLRLWKKAMKRLYKQQLVAA